jgi:hypothetical protein
MIAVESRAANEQLFELVLSPLRWQILNIGLELEIFDALKSESDAACLSLSLNLNQVALTLMLDAMCNQGFVEKEDGLYRLSSLFEPYIIRNSQRSMRSMLLHLAKVRHASDQDVIDMLRTGESKHLASGFSTADFWQKSIDNLRSFHLSMSVTTMSELIFNLPEWPRVKRWLDLGAGSECLALNIHGACDGLDTSVFDLAPSAEKIKQNILKTEINVISGDYNLDGLGENYDLIWSSMSLYYAKDLDQLLTKILLSLSKGGMFVSLHEGLTHERTLPEQHVLGRIIPALSGMDVSFDKGFIAERMLAVGFSGIKSKTVKTPYGPMELDVGYR